MEAGVASHQTPLLVFTLGGGGVEGRWNKGVGGSISSDKHFTELQVKRPLAFKFHYL